MTLALDALTVRIAGKPVCTALSLQIEAGSRWAVLGVNGAGKTTLLTTLAGLRAPAAGTVRLGDDAVAALPARMRARRIALMAQDDHDDAESTVLDIALLGRLPHLAWWQAESARDEALAREALAAMGLSGLEARRAASLSGGERRRLALASLLVQDAPVWLLDEPTSHLDLHQQIALLERLRAQHARTLVMSLHDVNLAARYCTHALLIFGGGDCCGGPVEAMLQPAVLGRLYGHDIRRVGDGADAVVVPV